MGRFRRGGKPRSRSEDPEGHEGDSERRRRNFRMAPKRLTKSVKRIAPPESCPCWKIVSYLVPIIIMLASAAGLIVATGNSSRFTPTFVKNLIPTFKNSQLVDPFASNSTGGSTTLHKWNNGGGHGLKMEILNALTDTWDPFFNLAVSDWDYGNPDALTLKSAKVSADTVCTAVEGKSR